MVEVVRKELELSFTHLTFISLLRHLQLVALSLVLLSLRLPPFVAESFFGCVHVLVDVLRSEFSYLFF